MKTKFFLCIRPTVIETDDGDYLKPPPPAVGSSYTAVLGKFTRRDIHHKKRVAQEKFKYIRQLSIKSNGNISEGESENHVQKSQKASKITRSASEALISRSFSDDESVSWRKPSNIVTNESNSSCVYLMVSILFFTIFLGKVFGIICTLVLACSLYGYPHRKNDGNDSRKSEKVVVEKGSPEYNKRVIMDGLLKRKSHYRENYTLFN
ncbi:hypothetical protein QVD17_18171 [Tagetes erecta]|uniref:Uncharacterized protein n=1 Tax=Tagetes erecta TaxID=13708 RepID=A0AAD8NVU0_TARER|nr:hypothetical protein QVD17_18171 [Tagetes erecta]